jgi:hypothetical protein
MGPVQQILLTGDYAKGLDTGTIDVVLVGKQLNTEYIEALEEKVEGIIERKVNFYLTSKLNPTQLTVLLYENESTKNKVAL